MLTDWFKIRMEAERFPASFVTFDCIYQGNRELVFQSLMERKQKLSGIVMGNDRIAVSRYIEQRRNGTLSGGRGKGTGRGCGKTKREPLFYREENKRLDKI